MTKSEHIEWCKERALAYLPHDPGNALASMTTDLKKHPETSDIEPGAVSRGVMALRSGDPRKLENWINSFK